MTPAGSEKVIKELQDKIESLHREYDQMMHDLEVKSDNLRSQLREQPREIQKLIEDRFGRIAAEEFALDLKIRMS